MAELFKEAYPYQKMLRRRYAEQRREDARQREEAERLAYDHNSHQNINALNARERVALRSYSQIRRLLCGSFNRSHHLSAAAASDRTVAALPVRQS